ncbi:hypothetical protein [Flavobacterium nitrogenifigens]|uniref:Uncharacterized protein n=1 Tax=Flavobacterium nitrogenifigens TaxID=1617283 RepID=A0A521F892_9FLAO|nr:hypothetical protein [Flavobacterium nitrogenifigens]KAF2337831.1 hypothetical protein DM397_03895 [Flavobacterium nitrogenifigens]SMO92435.1 hypothetical protein SAMN06265220_10769 [Flavobacterium nitrogenifigens]
MGDINKIKIIHEIKNKFSVDDIILKKFIEQIENSNYKDNIERFFRGYKVEDNFHVLFSAMPWVKLIHELGQVQLPTLSKETYQVPDFTIFFETSKKEHRPILLEVKSVKGDSQSLEVMSKQLNACVEYSKIVSNTFLYAIYWDKYQTWTLNAIENFEVKTKKHKITFFDAITNDLSVIVGDITFLINQPIYRKTICNKSITDSKNPQHQKFGVIISDSVSINNINFIEIESFESAIIDSSIKMKVIDTKIDGDKTTITEISNINYFLKLSTLTLRHLAVFNVKLNEQYADISRRMIVEFFKKLNITKSFSIPAVKTVTSDILYKQAFEESWVNKNYSLTK